MPLLLLLSLLFKEEYGLMMEALLSGKDLSTLKLPTIDHLMGKAHDDL